RKSFIVPAAKSRRTKKLSYFQPFSIIEIVYYEKEGRELPKITECSFDVLLMNLATHPVRLALASLFLEVIKACLQEEEANPPLFEFIVSSFIGIDQLQNGLYAFTMHRILHLTKYLGFFPLVKVSDFTQPVRFLPEEGWIIEATTQEPIHTFFFQLLKSDDSSCTKFHLDKSNRKYFLSLLLRFYQLHIANFPEIRSINIFEEIFG
ncbi:MAG: DNA repair protein RecO C-terminal domain-containing protein, partial [Bacteroidia bacterium]|nr:DNA repair protein RecO C-terminal domain-containing protein [Bacteroidia bacterium]